VRRSAHLSGHPVSFVIRPSTVPVTLDPGVRWRFEFRLGLRQRRHHGGLGELREVAGCADERPRDTGADDRSAESDCWLGHVRDANDPRPVTAGCCYAKREGLAGMRGASPIAETRWPGVSRECGQPTEKRSSISPQRSSGVNVSSFSVRVTRPPESRAGAPDLRSARRVVERTLMRRWPGVHFTARRHRRSLGRRRPAPAWAASCWADPGEEPAPLRRGLSASRHPRSRSA